MAAEGQSKKHFTLCATRGFQAFDGVDETNLFPLNYHALEENMKDGFNEFAAIGEQEFDVQLSQGKKDVFLERRGRQEESLPEKVSVDAECTKEPVNDFDGFGLDLELSGFTGLLEWGEQLCRGYEAEGHKANADQEIAAKDIDPYKDCVLDGSRSETGVADFPGHEAQIEQSKNLESNISGKQLAEPPVAHSAHKKKKTPTDVEEAITMCAEGFESIKQTCDEMDRKLKQLARLVSESRKRKRPSTMEEEENAGTKADLRETDENGKDGLRQERGKSLQLEEPHDVPQVSGSSSGCKLTLAPPALSAPLLHAVDVSRIYVKMMAKASLSPSPDPLAAEYCDTACTWVNRVATDKELAKEWVAVTAKSPIRITGARFRDMLLRNSNLDITTVAAIVRLFREIDVLMSQHGDIKPNKHYVSPEWAEYITGVSQDDETSTQFFRSDNYIYQTRMADMIMVPVRTQTGWACYSIDIESKVLTVLDPLLVQTSPQEVFMLHESKAKLVLAQAVKCMAKFKCQNDLLKYKWSIKIQVVDSPKCEPWDSSIYALNCMRWFERRNQNFAELDISTVHMDMNAGFHTRIDFAFKVLHMSANKAKLPAGLPLP
ncbi:hypothetical protein EJB05_48763, partial [Eragrostis curvula]